MLAGYGSERQQSMDYIKLGNEGFTVMVDLGMGTGFESIFEQLHYRTLHDKAL